MALKVVYPAPPPTSNCLNPRQRAQLLRSSKKLTKLLGATPRFIDESDDSEDYICDSPSSDTSKKSSSPFDSLGRSSSRTSTSIRRPSTSSSSSSATSLILGSPSELLLTRHTRTNSEPPSPSPRSETPVMRIALPQHHSRPSSSWSGEEEAEEDMRFMIRPKPLQTLLCRRSSSLSDTPSFTIPSAQTQKRAKLDRLRRKFGDDDIPLDLVFPQDTIQRRQGDWNARNKETYPSSYQEMVVTERGTSFTIVNQDLVEQNNRLNNNNNKPLPVPPPSTKKMPRDSMLLMQRKSRRASWLFQDEELGSELGLGEEKSPEYRLSFIMESPSEETGLLAGWHNSSQDSSPTDSDFSSRRVC